MGGGCGADRWAFQSWGALLHVVGRGAKLLRKGIRAPPLTNKWGTMQVLMDMDEGAKKTKLLLFLTFGSLKLLPLNFWFVTAHLQGRGRSKNSNFALLVKWRTKNSVPTKDFLFSFFKNWEKCFIVYLFTKICKKKQIVKKYKFFMKTQEIDLLLKSK
jgi:hypothetical protein